MQQRRAALGQLVLMLWLAALWPEGARCASAMSGPHAALHARANLPRVAAEAPAGTAFLWLAAPSRLAAPGATTLCVHAAACAGHYARTSMT